METHKTIVNVTVLCRFFYIIFLISPLPQPSLYLLMFFFSISSILYYLRNELCIFFNLFYIILFWSLGFNCFFLIFLSLDYVLLSFINILTLFLWSYPNLKIQITSLTQLSYDNFFILLHYFFIFIINWELDFIIFFHRFILFSWPRSWVW